MVRQAARIGKYGAFTHMSSQTPSDTIPQCAGVSVGIFEAAWSAVAERQLSSAACSTSYSTSIFPVGQVWALKFSAIPRDATRHLASVCKQGEDMSFKPSGLSVKPEAQLSAI